MNNVVAQSSSPGSRTIPDGGISLGLGLTNECNLACAFCYRDPTRADRLSLDQVKAVMERLPVRSVNLGTGENGMHPDFRAILAYLRTKPVKLTITSNGHSVAVLKDDELRAFHDIEFSLDYSTQAEQDAQRGEGNWALIHQQAERCVRLRIPVTIIAVMCGQGFERVFENRTRQVRAVAVEGNGASWMTFREVRKHRSEACSKTFTSLRNYSGVAACQLRQLVYVRARTHNGNFHITQ